jgi:uncharacterized membrane protein YccC
MLGIPIVIVTPGGPTTPGQLLGTLIGYAVVMAAVWWYCRDPRRKDDQ